MIAAQMRFNVETKHSEKRFNNPATEAGDKTRARIFARIRDNGENPRLRIYCFLSTAAPFSSNRIALSSLRKSAALSGGISTCRTT